VTSPIRYYPDWNNKNKYVEVPAGYRFDFNSVPRLFWNIIAPQDFAIAVIHDYLYSRPFLGCENDKQKSQPLSRKEIDKICFE
jgi:hypothetical protein